MRKKFLSVFCLVALIALIAGCTCGPSVSFGEDCKWKVGFVTDVGEIDDKSFNEAGWNGVKQGIEALGQGEECYGYIETQDAKDYESNIVSFIEEGANIIVTSGFAMGEKTNEMAKKYPDIYFIGTDQ